MAHPTERGRAASPPRSAASSTADRWAPPAPLDAAAGWSWRVLLVAAAIGLVLSIVSVLSTVFVPMALAAFLTAALLPLDRALRRRGWRPGLAAGACILLVIVSLGAVGWGVVRSVVEPWDSISGHVREGIDRVQAEVGDHAGSDASASVDTIRDDGSDLRGLLLRGALSVVGVATSILSTTVLTLLVLFFFLKDGPTMWAWLTGAVGRRGPLLDRVGRAGWVRVRGFVRATALVALFDAAMIGLGALVLGVPAAGAIFAVTFVCAFIPYFGAFAAGLLACLLAVSEGGISLGLAMLAVVLVVQQVESNALQPLVVGGAVRLHPLVVALGVVAGGVVAGVLGMFVAIPLLAAITAGVGEVRKAEAEAVEAEAAAAGAAPD